MAKKMLVIELKVGDLWLSHGKLMQDVKKKKSKPSQSAHTSNVASLSTTGVGECEAETGSDSN